MPQSEQREFIEQLAEEFLERFRAGERPSWQEYAQRHPNHAGQIAELFPMLVAVEDLAPSGRPAGSIPGPPELFLGNTLSPETQTAANAQTK